MNKKKSFAAIAACVGTVCLGSCTDEQTVYQGETQEMSKLRVMTRTEGTSTPPNEGIYYLFNHEGKCTNIVDNKDMGDNKAISATPGKYKLIAIGSNDLSVYNLPDMENATDSSIITLKEGKTPNDLLLKTDSITLNQGETAQISMTLSREVICFKNITIANIPTDVTSTDLIIGPMYKAIKLNGTYTDETSDIKINLTKDATTGNWTNHGDSVFSLPSKGNPTIKMILTSADVIKEYTYQTDKPLKKNYYARLDVDYYEGLISYLRSSMSAPDWAGTDSISISFTEGNLTKVDSVKTEEQKSDSHGDAPVAGKGYQGYYVVSVDANAKTAVLLARKGVSNISNKEEMDKHSKKLEKPKGAEDNQWRLPTLEECKIFLMENNVTSIDSNVEIDKGRYYFEKDNEVHAVLLSIKNGVRNVKEDNILDGYDSSYLYRPVIDIKY